VPVPSTLEIRLGGRLVGSFTRLPGGITALSFNDDYTQDAHRPVLSLGFLDAYRRARRPKPSVNNDVPGFFANLLPEADLRRYVAHRAGLSPRDDFGLLWVTGDDLPGAVTLHDPQGRPLPPHAEGGPETAPALRSLLRFSLAGVQLKFSAVENARGGLTIRAQGRDGHFIVKLPSPHFAGVPENEHAMLRFAAAVGIDVPANRLVALRAIEGLPEEASALEGHALAIERFDRGEGEAKIHIEDFNQVFRQQPHEKYDNYAFSHISATIYRTMGNDALIDFINRLVFNLAIANSDMHLKNWSIIYRDGRTPQLAPAYDYVSTKLYVGGSDTGLALGSARSFPHVTLEQFERMAQRAQVSSRLVRSTALAMAERIRDEWTSYRGNVPDAVAKMIDGQFVTVPVLAGRRVTPAGSDAPSSPEHQEIA
jgi:serine/threonine-protein kinase HipA